MPVSVTGVTPIDGRVERSRRTRLAIVEALRELHRDGILAPRISDIAARSGVAKRTVWAHFADSEALFIEAGRRDLEIAADMVSQIPTDLETTARIAAFCSQRARIFEAMAPTWRAARLREPFSAELQQSSRALFDLAFQQLLRTFAPELERFPPDQAEQLTHCLHATTLWSHWESLRREIGLTAAAAETAVRRSVTALFTDAGLLAVHS